jgi:predicted anti-sigma-YlaC factor YlaD
MISCTDFLNDMSNYLDGEVAAEVRAQLEAHLSHCQSCNVVIDSTRKTIQIVADSQCFDLPEHVIQPITERIFARIKSQQQ